jgi:outer membrane protein assembly factor BamB
METPHSPHEPDPSAAQNLSSAAATLPLRWWPAAVVLCLMAVLKGLPSLFESPPLPLMMLGVMGPPAVGLLLFVWWLFASRAGVKEKLIGVVVLLLIAVATIALSHESMKGMTVAILQVPVGLAAFAVPLMVLSTRAPAIRLGTALLAATVGFGFFDLLQFYGTTGRFSLELGWRWTPTAEDEYLKTLADATDGTTILEGFSDADVIERTSATWSDFRGANRDGIVDGVILASDWKGSEPRLVWKTRIGPGWSSFTVAGNRLFTQEQRGEQEAVICLDAETGSTVWTYAYPARFWEAIGGAGPRATPTIGDNQLFALGADGQLSALRPSNGEVLWTRNLHQDAQREPPTWGWSSSPLLVGSQVIVHAGGNEDRGLLAYDRDTGALLWSVASGDHSYSSPQRASFAGVDGILMLTNNGLQFLSELDGSTIWEYSYPTQNYRAIQPLVLGDDVLIGTSLGEGTRMIDVEFIDDQWKISERWTSLDIKPDFNDYAVYQGYLYGFDGNILACVDIESGERQWKRGRYGNGQLVLLRESGQLLIASEKGELVLVKADPERLTEEAKIPAIDGKTWNHPVLIGNRVYIRNGQEAACFELPVNIAP